MKQITLREALSIYVDAVLTNSQTPKLYLKDCHNQYHNVDEFDLMKYGMYCDDGYWADYKYILEIENSVDHKIFVEENNDEEH